MSVEIDEVYRVKYKAPELEDGVYYSYVDAITGAKEKYEEVYYSSESAWMYSEFIIEKTYELSMRR